MKAIGLRERMELIRGDGAGEEGSVGSGERRSEGYGVTVTRLRMRRMSIVVARGSADLKVVLGGAGRLGRKERWANECPYAEEAAGDVRRRTDRGLKQRLGNAGALVVVV